MELSDDEYEEWSQSVLKRWGALMERRGDGNFVNSIGKQYTAFLRFALKCYDIPAKAKAIWRKNKRGSGKHLALQIEYFGGARTVDVHVRRLRAKLGDSRNDWIKTVHSVGYKFN